MTNSPTEARIVELIRREFGAQVNDVSHLLTDAGRFDSLDLIKFTVECDEEFCIEITDDESQAAAEMSVREWAALIDAKLVERAVA